MNNFMIPVLLREDAYRMLAACYYPPTAGFMAENCCASLAAILEQVFPDAAACAADAAQIIGEDHTPLLVEYTRLFIGPFQLVAPPYGSVYLEDTRTVMGSSTTRVAAFYHANGLHLVDDFHELPDHFAVELEFMSYLVFKQREAENISDKSETARLISLQQEFLDSFLMPWLEPFTSAIISDGASPFYQAVARCTSSFINADYNALTSASND